MPMFQIEESASGQVSKNSSTIVAGTPESENPDGTVNFRVQDCGVLLRDGDLVRVRKEDVRRR